MTRRDVLFFVSPTLYSNGHDTYNIRIEVRIPPSPSPHTLGKV